MNYIEKFMADNGLVEGEVFDIKSKFDEKVIHKNLKFSEYSLVDNKGNTIFSLLCNLLSGICIVVKQLFIPKKGELYYYYSLLIKKVISVFNNGGTLDYALIKLGLVYRTEEECKANKQKTIDILGGVTNE